MLPYYYVLCSFASWFQKKNGFGSKVVSYILLQFFKQQPHLKVGEDINGLEDAYSL